MSMYECEKCHCVENTAVGQYWGHDEKLCSECGTGKWHGIFKKRPAKGMFIDQNNHLWSEAQLDAGYLPKHYKIVGLVGL